MSKKKTGVLIEVFRIVLNKYNLEKYKWQSYEKNLSLPVTEEMQIIASE
jgi:hypothetical protein